ncbi:MAG TPA: hypothetical protein VFU86_22095 [Terriglobales bacterium]|nr:hypothetical protein [Terriglobales bacterium]
MSNAAAAETSGIVDQLNERVRQLEVRVSALEGEPRKQAQAPPPTSARRDRAPETWQGFPSVELPGVISTIGIAVLGMAGAYIFRALAESGAVPKLPVLVMAILYAASWMVYAIRVHSRAFASLTYASASLLILSPMVWETTVRFEFLSPALAGAILAAFCALTLALTWKRGLEAIPWLTVAATMGVAIALFLATRDVAPLTFSILAVAAMMEAAACFGHVLSSRMLTALCASLSVALVISLMSSEPLPEGYARVSPATLVMLWSTLLAIYFGSIAVRAFWLRREIGLVDTVEGTLAFVVAAFGAARASERLVAPALGLILLLLAAACYWGALSRFADDSSSRNRRILFVWAAALLIAGSIFLLPPTACLLLLAATAMTESLLYARRRSTSLGLQISVLLAAAVVLSAWPQFVWSALAGTLPVALSWPMLITTAAALLCYLTASCVEETSIAKRSLWIFPSVIVALAAAALTVTVIGWLTMGRWELTASRLSAVRSIAICALAVILASLGLLWRRIELGWVAYGAVAFGALKLLFEDLPSGNSSTLVFSFLFYGLVLIVLPRLTRRGRADYLHPKKYFVFSA